MALQIRRGLQSELDTVTPLEGEPIWVIDQEKLVIGDGITQGGINVTQNLQDLRITSAGVKTSLYDAAATGTIALINGTNSFELAVNSTGTHITGPLFVSTTASVTTLRFADGSVQTTADTANYDQSLNTTDRVTFAGMTLTNIADFNTSTFTIYRNGEQSLYSNTLGTLTLGNGSGATNIASASDTDFVLGSQQNTHNILLSTTEAKIRGKNTVEIITMTTSTTEFKAGGTTQASVRTTGLHIDNGYINGSGNGIIVQNYNGQPLVFKDNTSGNLKTLASFSSSTIEMGVLGQGSILINGTNDVTFGSGFSAGSGGFQLGNSQNQPFKFGNYNSGQSYSLGVSTSGANVYGPNAENLASFTTSSVTFDTVSSVRPQSNNTIDLGVAGTSWKTVYAKNIADSTQIAIGVNDGTTSTSLSFDNDSVQLYVNDGGGAWSTLYVDRFSSKLLTENNYGIDINNVPGKIDVTGKVLPSADNTYDLGDATYRWRNLYVSGEITANKLTIQYTTVTTTIVETDDIIKTTNTTAAGSGVGAIVATGGISGGNLYINNTATITYTNIATEGQLRSQSTTWPFGENTATIMTIDTTVYGSARLNILVGATLGLDSHTERLTMDILTNGVDVLNAQSGVLATTSTGLCSYTAELSGTDILVKAVALDPVNFLGFEAKTIAELVAKPVGGLGGL